MKNISYYQNIHSVSPLYLIISKAYGYIEESNGDKYLVFASTDKNKEVLTKYIDLWDGIKNLIKKVNDKPGKYDKGSMKIKFKSDDNLHLNKTLKPHMLTVIVRSAFKEDGKYYPQGFSDECLYEL